MAVTTDDRRVAEALAEIERLKAERDHLRKVIDNGLRDYMTLEAERDALRADAERYRWLRDHDAWMRPCYVQRRGYRSTAADARWETWDEFEGWQVSTANVDDECYMAMDAALDAALAAKGAVE